ncbi:MAG TPA: GH116 family glycosyl hydrolase [Halomicronema sp.]
MIPQPALPQIPSCTWNRPLGKGWEKPYTVRYSSNLDDGPWHGMPLGGFGAGCIGRSSRGDFNLWHLDGGEHTFKTLPACQFSIFEETAGQKQAYALSTQPPEDDTLESWNWYPATTDDGKTTGTYHALYPRSWFVYENIFKTELTCEQFSPIWPDKYQENSYPIAIFEWTAHNPTDQPITLSIMLTWQNTVGWWTNLIKTPQVCVRDDGSPVYEYQPSWGQSTGNFNEWREDFHRVGCLMNRVSIHDDIQEGDGQLCIATITNPGVEVYYHTRWNPAGDGSEIWNSFATDGTLPDKQDETRADPSEQIACALTIRLTLRPGKTRKIPFILAWDLPVTEFGAGNWRYRRYTDFFGRDGKNTWSMVRTALKLSDVWKENIEAWQNQIINQPDLPDWFKMALFNELYALTGGGTLWTAADERDPKGQFAVLECIDYRWYESLDVRLYGSFALLMLWPELEKSVISAFARAIPHNNATERLIGYNKSTGLRKIKGATPHDLGAPNEHPFEETNYTSYQDCNLWKDLPCDFVLQVYRDYLFTGSNDIEFLSECWPAITQTLAYLKTFDIDNDGIPENSGAPDQTFDDWRLSGISAYCGGLWIAALQAAIEIGKILLLKKSAELSDSNIAETMEIYQSWLAQAKPLYQEKLWNGKYYNLDTESNSEVVMADQMCGQFYAQLLGLEDVVPRECAESALQTVYEACFLKFNEGKFGAANGVKIDGRPVNPDATHPLEVWTGINFGLAAFMVQMGMKDEAFKLTEVVVKQVYENGLQFRTPEAITAAGTFRASHYLRAMAIWAIYGVLIKGGKLSLTQ